MFVLFCDYVLKYQQSHQISCPVLDNSNLSKFWTILIYAQFFGQAILFARPTGLAKIRRQRPKCACDRVRLWGTLLFFVLYYLDIASGFLFNGFPLKVFTMRFLFECPSNKMSLKFTQFRCILLKVFRKICSRILITSENSIP